MPLGLLSSPRGVAVSWYEFPGYLWVSRDGSGYLGMALVSREGTRALASFPPLPLFEHMLILFPTSYLFSTFLYGFWVVLYQFLDTFMYIYALLLIPIDIPIVIYSAI